MWLHRRGHPLVLPRVISDLHTFVGPWVDLFSPDAVEAGYPWLAPITVSLIWRHPPAARALAWMVQLAAAVSPTRPPPDRRIPSMPRVLGAPPPSPLDVVDAALDETHHLRALSARVQSLAPRFPIRVVPHAFLQADFPPAVGRTVQDRGAIRRGPLEVLVSLMEPDAHAALKHLVTLSHGAPALARVQRPSAAREALTAYGRQVLAPVSRLSEALHLVDWFPTGAVIDGARLSQPIPHEVLEAYTTRIQSPLSKVQSAYPSASGLPPTVVLKAAMPLLPEVATRGPNAGVPSPRNLVGELTAWPAHQIRQATAYGTTLRALGRRLLHGLVAGLTASAYERARYVAGIPPVEPLSMTTGVLPTPIANAYLDALQAVGGPSLTDAIDTAMFPQHLPIMVANTYRAQALTPISRLSKAFRLVDRLPAKAVPEEVLSPPPAPSHPSQLPVSGVTVWGPGFRMPPLVRGLPPRTRGEAPSVDRGPPHPELSPAHGLVDHTKIPRDDEWDAWLPSMREAAAVASHYRRWMSRLVSGEIMAQRRAVIPPFIQEAAAAATHALSRSEVMRRPWSATPITPVFMELGFGISEAKQLYPAVEAISRVRRAFDGSRLLPQAVHAYPAGAGEALERFVRLLSAPAERYTLERIPLEAPRAVPTVKLPELMSHLASTRAPTRPERPPRGDRQAFERPRSIEVKVEAPRDEQDLRALRRQLTRILRDEARRHGVYV